MRDTLIVAVLAAALGAGGMWWYKDGQHKAYIQEQKDDLKKREAAASKDRDKADRAWAEVLGATLQRASTAEGRQAALDRCIRAGRCSPSLRDRMLQHCPAPESVPATEVPDGHDGGAAVPAPSGGTAIAGVLTDCTVVTKKLNHLRLNLCRQPNFPREEYKCP